MPQSQQHGFIIENYIRKNLNQPEEKNNTNIHDIELENENISVKSSGSNGIDCGDILRLYNYDFKKKHTIIVIIYRQVDDYKIISNIYEINFTKQLHKKLFGNITKEQLEKYINSVKSIPHGKNTGETYLMEKDKLQKEHNMLIKISPKVDSKRQRRVQSHININNIDDEFIIYDSLKTTNTPNTFRKKEIPISFVSPPRKRGGLTVDDLKQLCRENYIKGFSRCNKDALINLLTNHGVKLDD